MITPIKQANPEYPTQIKACLFLAVSRWHQQRRLTQLFSHYAKESSTARDGSHQDICEGPRAEEQEACRHHRWIHSVAQWEQHTSNQLLWGKRLRARERKGVRPGDLQIYPHSGLTQHRLLAKNRPSFFSWPRTATSPH